MDLLNDVCKSLVEVHLSNFSTCYQLVSNVGAGTFENWRIFKTLIKTFFAGNININIRPAHVLWVDNNINEYVFNESLTESSNIISINTFHW